MIQTIINLVTVASSLVVLVITLLAINEMTAATNHLIRISYTLISTSALAGVIVPFMHTGWQPSPACCFGMTGLAILMVADRRKANRRGMARSQIHVIHQHRGHGG